MAGRSYTITPKTAVGLYYCLGEDSLRSNFSVVVVHDTQHDAGGVVVFYSWYIVEYDYSGKFYLTLRDKDSIQLTYGFGWNYAPFNVSLIGDILDGSDHEPSL